MTDDEMKTAYIRFLADPENDEKDDGMFVGPLKLTFDQLRRVQANNPDIPAKALEIRRTTYLHETKLVDKALLDKAKSGDARSIELWYRRFESWSPKQADEARADRPAD